MRRLAPLLLLLWTCSYYPTDKPVQPRVTTINIVDAGMEMDAGKSRQMNDAGIPLMDAGGGGSSACKGPFMVEMPAVQSCDSDNTCPASLVVEIVDSECECVECPGRDGG